MDINKGKYKRIFLRLKRLLLPPYWIVITGVPLATYGLIIIFIKQWQDKPLAYIAYIFSAYILASFLFKIHQIHHKIVSKFLDFKVVNIILSHPFIQMFFNDVLFRGKVSLYQGMFVNIMFAVFKLINSWVYKSIWFGAVAVYYISLSIIRYVLVYFIKKSSNHDDKVKQQYKGYRICGFLMLFLNIAMTGMVIQMVWNNQSYKYPGYIIYISALYSFYAFTISIINIFKYSKLHSPLISASKILSFSGALMSILSLQTAMITQFGGESGFQRLMNSLVGGSVCLIVFGLAIYMIIKGNKELKLNHNL
ncbi:hypothetical protein [Clostridium intestinale]|uniref:hypothetical protein n=1 Tax=Clostridium intestinale TaxID=36845 RepID=UPI0028E5E81D|nr:hypothetical protein [Clostridium intestinale]